ncbi:MAG: LamG domain-containing protein [Planctomycetota bacterium]|jgi:hypothetical protein
MSQKVYSLISFVLVLCLAGNTLAATLTWDNDGGLGDRLWSSAANWDKTGPASAPTAGDDVVIDDLFTDAANGPIIQVGIDAECSTLGMGINASPPVEAVLTMNGGTLSVGSSASLGELTGEYRFDLSGGTITVGGNFFAAYDFYTVTTVNMTGGSIDVAGYIDLAEQGNSKCVFNMDAGDITTASDFWITYEADACATFTINDGNITIGGDLYIAEYDNSEATLNVNGGYIYVGEDLEIGDYGNSKGVINMSGGRLDVNPVQQIYVGFTSTRDSIFNITGGEVHCGELELGECWGGTPAGDGHLKLHGGIIYATDLWIGGDGGSTADVTDGVLIADADLTVPTGYLFNPGVDTHADVGNWTGTVPILADKGIITAFDVNSGEIITDDVNFPAEAGKRAVISVDYGTTNPGKTTLSAAVVDPNKAWNPSPIGGGQLSTVTLSWSPGENAASHEVYFGTSFADVNDATTASDPSIYRGSQPLSDVNYAVPETLIWDTPYFWRIDEVNNPTWKGTVWSFRTAQAKALDPYPADGDWYIRPDVVLGWTPGFEAATHEVYFGTSWDDVNDANTSDPNVYKGPQNRDANTYDTGTLEDLQFDTYYYWRIDEVNLAADVNRWKGDVWTFWVDYYLGVDDFNSYADHAALRVVWKDYWNDPASKNGAEVFVETDPDLVRSNESMKYWYKNYQKVGGKYAGSWAEASTADLNTGTDWTIGGAKALVLYFYGDPCNGKDTTSLSTDQMYVELEDSGTNAGIVLLPDMNAVKEDWWHEWDIDFQDAALSAVEVNNLAKVYIGFGGNAKTGQTDPGAGMTYGYSDTVYFDDIEIWPPWCRPEMVPTDFTGDCVTNYADVDIMGRDWLMYDYNTTAELPSEANLLGWWKFDEGSGTKVLDSSAYGHDGNTINPAPSWVAGRPGDPCDSAMHFDGVGDVVVIAEREGNTPGIYDADLMPDKFTVACWTKLDSFSYFDGFVSNTEDTGADECGFALYNSGWIEPDGQDFGFMLRTQVGGMNYIESDELYDTGRWYHVAGTYDGTYATLYVDGAPAGGPTNVGGPMLWESATNGNYPQVFAIGAYLDSNEEHNIEGVIDEVLFYDYGLSQGEIAVLAGFADPGVEYYQPVPSLANITDPEAKFFRKVNFRDFVILADHWLEGPTLWPQ